MKFGKLAPREDPRTLRFSALLAPALPPPPPAFSALTRALDGAKTRSIPTLFPMDGNNRYGDCTIAAACHAETLWEGWCGKRRIPKSKDCVATYFDLSGGQDSGLVELDVLNRWRHQGITGEKILAFAAVDRHNHEHVKQAISTFGGVYIGFRVQQNCLRDFRDRKVWTPGALLNEGHAVFVTGYSPNQIACLTWGSTQGGTWGWWDECVDEVYACLPGEAALSAFAPGLDLAALRSALESVTA